LDPPNPELAVGNVFGANMLNMFTMSAVALAFGGKRFLVQVAPEQGYLIVVAVVLTGAAILFGAIQWGANVGEVGISSVILIVLFVAGMWWVYKNRPAAADEAEEDPGMTLGKAWGMFGLVSLGVVIAGFFLAWSTDEIAGITGIASSTLGILLVSLVTTMPEASSTIAAARIGAMDLGVAGLYGSCAFNVTIMFYADPFFREGVLGNNTETAHFVAGGVAVGLMVAGLVLVLARNRVKSVVANVALALMATTYIVGAVVVATVGGIEDDETSDSKPSITTTRTPGE
jgi:cation:H+ antiporter